MQWVGGEILAGESRCVEVLAGVVLEINGARSVVTRHHTISEYARAMSEGLP